MWRLTRFGATLKWLDVGFSSEVATCLKQNMMNTSNCRERTVVENLHVGSVLHFFFLLLLLTLPLRHVPRCLLRQQLQQRRHQSRRAGSWIWSERQGQEVLDRQEQVGHVARLNGTRWLIKATEMKRPGRLLARPC